MRKPARSGQPPPTAVRSAHSRTKSASRSIPRWAAQRSPRWLQLWGLRTQLPGPLAISRSAVRRRMLKPAPGSNRVATALPAEWRVANQSHTPSQWTTKSVPKTGLDSSILTVQGRLRRLWVYELKQRSQEGLIYDEKARHQLNDDGLRVAPPGIEPGLSWSRVLHATSTTTTFCRISEGEPGIGAILSPLKMVGLPGETDTETDTVSGALRQNRSRNRLTRQSPSR